MARLLIKVTLFGSLIVLTLLAPFFALPVNYANNGLACSIDKHQRLATLKGPKIVFIGGSGVGFGLDSGRIESRTGYHVVNMGLFGQLGLRFMMDETKNDIHAGDILVVVPEYQHFFYHLDGDVGLLRLMRIYPASMKYLSSYKQAAILARNFPSYMKEQLLNNYENSKTISRMWDRRNMSEQGDFTGHLSEKIDVNKSAIQLFHSNRSMVFNPESIRLINEFAGYAKTRGARVYFMFPAIPVPLYEKHKALIAEVYKNLKEGLKPPMLNTPTSHNLPLEDFYDTAYHLGSVGREKRTDLVVSDLRKVMPDRPGVADGPSPSSVN
jgi:hypothetical protein